MLKNITYPPTKTYHSDSEYPILKFYLDILPEIKTLDLELGYFSSGAISVLAIGMAQFIQNDGVLRIVTNESISEKDADLIFDDKHVSEDNPDYITDNTKLDELKRVLEQREKHFYNCLLFLKQNNRLIIQPVKPNGRGIAHNKIGLAYDGENKVYYNGSANFTGNALLNNAESIEVSLDWTGDIEVTNNKIIEFSERFEKLINKEHKNYTYLEKDELTNYIKDKGITKNLEELLSDSLDLELIKREKFYSENLSKEFKAKNKEFEEKIDKIKSTPHFPRFNNKVSFPRPYQVDAYKAWVKNNKKGIFAMATGTGKTITALNCVLEEYNETGAYKAIFLVPSIALLNQWEEEVKSFNFQKILKVGGGNKWEKTLANYSSDLKWGIEDDLIIITTNGSFVTDRFQKYYKSIESKFIFVADEAHNMGSFQIKELLRNINPKKRIGLSATPERIYDPEGTKALDTFFNDSSPYTYEFSMERALSEGFLSEYKYYPHIVELNENEFEEYVEITKKLLKFFDFEKGTFKDDPAVEKLLLKRKSIIHKASNKVDLFKQFLQELEKKDLLKYVFTYVPEGFDYNDDSDANRILENFIKVGFETIPDLKMNSYTADDDDLKGILRGFSDGKIDMLFAMKMLDEGVDVPRAEVGIFCSSTGNPRQFIQRRGRLLRKHNDKTFATIYDMVVIPRINNVSNEYFNLERNMVKTEMQRVAYFASLSMNYYDSKDNLEVVLNKYDLNLDQIISEL